MFKKLAVLFLGVAFPLASLADDSLVKFKGGIGVDPVSTVVVNADGSVTVNRNIVRGVNPPGQIWRIADLSADVRTDGGIKVRFATLICEAAPPFVLHNTTLTGVPLEADGDFQIDDVLSPPPPTPCASPVLLIRNLGGAWFAAGVPDLKD
jgi:hypothetical protein